MKIVGSIVGILLLLIVGVAAYLFFFAGDVVKRGMEQFGPQYLGTSVNVDSVDMDFAAGTGTIQGVEIGNPSGFDGPYSMKLGLVTTTLDTAQSSADLVVIKNLAIDGASLAAVAQGRKTNLQQIMDNLEKAVGGFAEDTAPQTESEMKFIVDRFSFTNADVSLNSDVLGNRDLQIPDIRLSDVGRKSNGATAAELARQLMKPITSAVSKAVVAQGVDLEGMEQQLKDRAKEKIGEKLKDLF